MIQPNAECIISNADDKVINIVPKGKKANIQTKDGKVLIGDKKTDSDVTIRPGSDGIIAINNQKFRGEFRFIVNDDGTMDIINALPIEAYLDGVVGAEMPSYWEAEALKAQTIAARTYSLYYKQKYGTGRSWDVTRTQSTQVYKGVSAETGTIRQAVKDTYGMVMTCQYSDGINRIFPAYYSSVCGGHTEDAVNVLGRDHFNTLVGVKCGYCRKVARKNVFNWAPVVMTKQEVTEKLCSRYTSIEKLEGIDGIQIKKKGYLDRIISVNVIGKNGKTDNLRGEDLRIALDPTGMKLKSAVFKIEDKGDSFVFSKGIGHGHGVGLCQCGAEAMARKGQTYQQILEHYYCDMKLHNLDYSE